MGSGNARALIGGDLHTLPLFVRGPGAVELAAPDPLIGIAIGAAVGYLIAYLIHGSDSTSGSLWSSRLREDERPAEILKVER